MKVRKDKDGILLFEKITGLNILMDEIEVSSPDLSPRHVSVSLLEKCNLKCSYCYLQHSDSVLNYEILKEYIDILDRNGCLSVGLGGGEPTLYPHLMELLIKISNTNMGCTLTTNGSATVEFYKKILEKVQLIRFSIDGVNDVYEKNRNQSFKLIIEKLVELRKYSPNIGLNYLLTNETINQLDSFKAIINLIKPKEILLIPCLDNNHHRLLSSNSEMILKDWITSNIDYPLNFSYSSIDIIDNEYILPIQEYNDFNQKYYFAHISARSVLMKNVFEKKGLIINKSLEDALRKYREED